MQLNISIVGILLPTIPLMIVKFGNRCSLLTGLIGNLHDTVINGEALTYDSARFFARSPAFAKDCGLSPSSRPLVRLLLPLTFQR